MKTENLIPNRKVWVPALAGIVTLFVINKVGGDSMSADMKLQIGIVVSGVLYAVYGYFIPPAKGDGIVEK